MISDAEKIMVETLFNDSPDGRAICYIAMLAIKAKKKFREKRDPSEIIALIEFWLKMCDVSRTEANNILKIVGSKISLRNSVI